MSMCWRGLRRRGWRRRRSRGRQASVAAAQAGRTAGARRSGAQQDPGPPAPACVHARAFVCTPAVCERARMYPAKAPSRALRHRCPRFSQPLSALLAGRQTKSRRSVSIERCLQRASNEVSLRAKTFAVAQAGGSEPVECYRGTAQNVQNP
jgi:hypothetical protein